MLLGWGGSGSVLGGIKCFKHNYIVSGYCAIGLIADNQVCLNAQASGQSVHC